MKRLLPLLLALVSQVAFGQATTPLKNAFLQNDMDAKQFRILHLNILGSGAEPALGNPSVSGYVLTSTTTGVRSWAAAGSGGGGGISNITDLSPLFTTVVTPTDATFVLSNAPADSFFGNGTGSSASPTYMNAATARTALGLGTMALQPDAGVATVLKKGNGTGGLEDAVPNTDYLTPFGDGSSLLGVVRTTDIGSIAQAWDTDLDSISALSTTSFGRGALTQADAAAFRSYIGANIGAGDAFTNTSTSVDSEIALFSGTAGKTLKRATTSGILKGTSGVIGAASAGTDYLAPTGSGTGLVGVLKTANNLSDLSNIGSARIVLGLVIGTNVQAWNSQLDSISALTTTSFARGALESADAAAFRSYIGAGSGGGDASTNTSTSVDGEGALFEGTSGKSLKRLTTTGILKGTSGVISAASAGTDYLAPAGSGTALTGVEKTANKAAASGYASLDAGTLVPVAQIPGTTVGKAVLSLTNPSAITFLRMNADNSVTAQSAANYLTDIGGTTVGKNVFTLTNPSAIRFLKINADNSVTAEAAATHLASIGAEPALGNPGTDGFVLTSTAAGVRSWSSAAAGTVTTFTAGNLSPLFTSSVANGSSTPALTFSLSNAAGTSWFGNSSGSSGAPAFNTTALPIGLIPTGTTSTTVPLGNDTRFPASVTGIRKGAGAGSADTAAAAGTDYLTPSGSGAALTGVEKTANKATANGYASLDSSTLVPIAQLPFPAEQVGANPAVATTWPNGKTSFTEGAALGSVGLGLILPATSSFKEGQIITLTDSKTTGNYGRAVIRGGSDTLNGGIGSITPFIAGGADGHTKRADFKKTGTNWQWIGDTSQVDSFVKAGDASTTVTPDLSTIPTATSHSLWFGPSGDSYTLNLTNPSSSANYVLRGFNLDPLSPGFTQPDWQPDSMPDTSTHTSGDVLTIQSGGNPDWSPPVSGGDASWKTLSGNVTTITWNAVSGSRQQNAYLPLTATPATGHILNVAGDYSSGDEFNMLVSQPASGGPCTLILPTGSSVTPATPSGYPDLSPGAGVVDMLQGHFTGITGHEWAWTLWKNFVGPIVAACNTEYTGDAIGDATGTASLAQTTTSKSFFGVQFVTPASGGGTICKATIAATKVGLVPSGSSSPNYTVTAYVAPDGQRIALTNVSTTSGLATIHTNLGSGGLNSGIDLGSRVTLNLGSGSATYWIKAITTTNISDYTFTVASTGPTGTAVNASATQSGITASVLGVPDVANIFNTAGSTGVNANTADPSTITDLTFPNMNVGALYGNSDLAPSTVYWLLWGTSSTYGAGNWNSTNYLNYYFSTTNAVGFKIRNAANKNVGTTWSINLNSRKGRWSAFH